VLTRRHFIERAALAGGVSLAYETMTGLGLLAAPQTSAFNLQGNGSGVKVIVLGAGIAGMTVAYELGKLGYACQVLEARERPGGRAHTIRRGTVSEEEGSTQTCGFDEGQYFNCGAMRIAYHHTTTLDYCRELQVPVETFALVSEAAYLYQTKTATMKDRRVRFREVHTDMDGYVSELLSKAVSSHALDEAISTEDQERLLEYLRSKGALDASGKYKGGALRGPDTTPVGSNTATSYTPFPLSDLLGSRSGYYLDLGFQYQQSMLQVIGGTDHLPRALAARLGKKITYKAAVTAIRQREQGVTVTYRDSRGASHEVQGDYCVAALPLPLLGDIETDFPAEIKAAIKAVPYAAAGKMGLQFKRRFWEEDDQIFGGASKTDMEIGQVVYPSSGYLGKKGVLVGYYLQGQAGRPIGDKLPADRLALALEQGGRIHPQYKTEFESGFSVAWHKVTWNRGSWSSLNPAGRKMLSQPQGRVYLAGDHLNMNAWMQGAFESARHTATAVHTRAAAEHATARV
jgi:monoamine oxidase